MKIDGRMIADAILTNLRKKVDTLKSQSTTPTLAVILVGDDPGSLSYIKQKTKAAETIGAQLILEHLSPDISEGTLSSTITRYNSDPNIHGLIVQRPLPLSLGGSHAILDMVSAQKDIDGFVPQSPFEVPVARAVMAILEHIHPDMFTHWLTELSITVIGRGDTAGKPIAATFQKNGCKPTIIHSQTPNTQSILRQTDIIVSCVGKKDVITKQHIKPGVILISVGLWRDETGKLHGDYEESDIEHTASFYTPTPGGVGPVNVACLMQNLVKACILQTGGTQ